MAVPRIGYPVRLKRLYDWLDQLMKMKVASQTQNTSTVLVDDDTLQFAMEANKKYRFRATVFYDTSAAGDFKYRHTGPASPTLLRILRRAVFPGDTAFSGLAVDTAYSAADVTVLSAAGTGGMIIVDGIIHNGANAGNFKLQWAQNTSDAGPTLVLAGSAIEWALVA